MIPPGKTRYIGAAYPGSEKYERLVAEHFNLSTAIDPEDFIKQVEGWASLNAYKRWLSAYEANAGNFLDHPVWGADRDLGSGHYLYGAMDDRYATNAVRVFVPGGLDAARDVVGKRALVIGAWDGTECLLLRALGAASVDSLDEVPAFGDMAVAQYMAWEIPGRVLQASLYELAIEEDWQAYDLVYVPGVLYHLTDLPTALTMLWAVLKPGGILAFESIADDHGHNGARYLGASVPGWNWWSPTPKCYEALLRDCGFPDGHTIEFAKNRGWWMGHRSEHLPALANGAAGFSRPDVLRTILHLTSSPHG